MKWLVLAVTLAGCGYDLNNPFEACLDTADNPGAFHVCGNECVDSSDPKHCGTSCTPCESANGTASCDGSKCSIACNPGFHECSGRCAANNDPMNCGPSCMVCPAVNGKATCDGTSCGLTCNGGFHLCSGVCKANNSINSCGSRCTPCPAPPANSTGSCEDIGNGLECVYRCDFSAPCGSLCCSSTQTCSGGTTCN